MTNGDGADAVIPAEQVEGAMRELRSHMGMIWGSAKWLEASGYHAVAIYFAILCMEEAAKYHVMSRCGDEGRAVMKGDMLKISTHEQKTAMFLDGVLASALKAGDGPGAALPSTEEMASMLERIKEHSVYFEFGGGVARTLEGLLGAGPTVRLAGLLGSVAAWGAAPAHPRGSGGRGSEGQRDPTSQANLRANLAEAMAISRGLETEAAHGDGYGIPHDQLDAALAGLEDHVAVLAKIAHGLHAKGHEAASVFMAVIAFEEGVRYYLLAKCRREKRGVEGKELRDLKFHKKKLTAFFRDVAKALGAANTGPDGKGYSILDPNSPVNLNAVKELAVYFAYMGEEVVTLGGIFGDSMRNLAGYINENVQGMISWMIMCDGDSRDPYRIHNKNPVHRERYEQLVRFRTDPENATQYDGWYRMVGMLKELNDEPRNQNVKGCKTRLAEIRKYGHFGNETG